jgi:hypothetical protein
VSRHLTRNRSQRRRNTHHQILASHATLSHDCADEIHARSAQQKTKEDKNWGNNNEQNASLGHAGVGWIYACRAASSVTQPATRGQASELALSMHLNSRATLPSPHYEGFSHPWIPTGRANRNTSRRVSSRHALAKLIYNVVCAH